MAARPGGIRSLSPTLALCLALIGAAAMIYYHQGLFMPRVVAIGTAQGYGNDFSFGNDFYQVWLSSRELMQHRIDPYSLQLTQEHQLGLYGRTIDPGRHGDPIDQRRFPYPAFADLLFWPAAEFPFAQARVWIVCLLVVLTLASVAIWFRTLDWRPGWPWIAVAALLAVSSYPALEGLYSVQLGLLVSFLLAASLLALRNNRLVLAGFLMALTTVKPQVTGLTIFYVFLWSLHDWRARARWLIGFFATMAVLLGASLAVLPHWIASWIHTVLAYHHYTSPPVVREVLTSPLGPRLAGPATTILTVASIVIAVIVAWRNRAAAANSPSFWLTVGILLSITTITILPGPAIYDHIILLPGVLLVVRNRRDLSNSPAARILLRIGAVVLFWPYVAAAAMIPLRTFISPADFQSVLALSVPFRAAGSLPFAVLALLAWTWRAGSRTRQEAA
jgi:hypothetical protein